MCRTLIVVVLALFVLVPVAAAGSVVVHAGTLYAVPGEAPIREATVVVVDGRIAEVIEGYRGLEDLDMDPGTRVIDLKDSYVTPGLIDCHTHLTGQSVPVFERMRRAMEETEAYAAIDGTVYARRTLLAGFTAVRNVGSPGQTGLALRDRINSGMIDGPRMYVSGPSVTVTGGHGDGTNSMSPVLRPERGAETAPSDGVAEVRKAVRARVREGVDLIKITATGGVLSMTAAGVDQQFFDDELASIVEAARMMGRKVAAHAHGAGGIKAALRAGVDSIEHGSYLDDEAIGLFVETGAYLVPTIHAGKYVAGKAEEPGYYPEAVRAKASAVGPVIQDAFGRAYKGGVKIAFGTDVGVGEHGTNALEFVYMHEAGMTAEDCLISATVNAADLIGASADIGTIEAGKYADLVAMARDPMGDVGAYQDVWFVMKGGGGVQGGVSDFGARTIQQSVMEHVGRSVPEHADVVIVGAGAAGLMCAVSAGRAARALGVARSVVVLDGARKIGVKILVAGGGRCNVTHERVVPKDYNGSSAGAIKRVLSRFGVEDTVGFFRELGVELKREETGKLFPVTDDAHTVLDALVGAVRDAGAVVHHPCKVRAVEDDGEGGFVVRGDWGAVRAGRVVLAAGGRALPRSGSDGSGYAIAEALGHSVTGVVAPALVPLVIEGEHALKGLSGIAHEARVEVRASTGKRVHAATGAVLCTHFGLSGPAILDVSRHLTAARAADAGARLAVGFVHDLGEESLDAALAGLGKRTVGRFVREMLPERLADALCGEAGVDPSTRGAELRREDRRALVGALTGLVVPVSGDRGFTHAEVTMGGVPMREVDPSTMGSRVRAGVYVIGEILDVDGRIGGFNFQWAWASGVIAGRACVVG